MIDSLHCHRLPQSWWALSVAQVAALTPLQPLTWPELAGKGITVLLKRDDQLHPSLAGNKFYKLLGHIRALRQSGQRQWLTFGGAYSNHLHAFATASAELAIPATAIIRGERPANVSPTLDYALAQGVQLRFVSRAEYRLKDQPSHLANWCAELGDVYCVPEGGSGLVGAMGCGEWLAQTLAMAPQPPTAICLAAGTGCTAAGVLSAAGTIPVHVYSALKANEQRNQQFATEIKILASKIAHLRGDFRQLPALFLEGNYHCGGYARFPDYLREFMLAFEAQTQVPLDPVYTAKLFWGIAEQARAGVWPPGSRLLILHTGGLQGRAGFSGLMNKRLDELSRG